MSAFKPSGQYKKISRRRLCTASIAVSGTGLSGCQARETTSPNEGQRMDKEKKDVVYFDVSAFDYFNRPIFEIRLNGIEVGSGGGALMTGVPIPLGTQAVTWRLGGPEGMPGNGDKVKATNQPVLQRPDAKLRCLGVHIYPDNSVELAPGESWPEMTPRGEEIRHQLEKKHGK